MNVCNEYCTAILLSKSHERFSSIRPLCYFLAGNLNYEKYSSQIGIICNIAESSFGLKCANGLESHTIAASLKKQIEDILKDLDETDLTHLVIEAFRNPDPKVSSCFKNRVDRIELYRQIDVANIMPEALDRNNALSEIAQKLATIGAVDEGVEEANKIPDIDCKNRTLFEIAQNLASRGSVYKAIDVTEKISDVSLKDSVLRSIAEAILAETGTSAKKRKNVDRAIDLTEKMSGNALKGRLLGKIVKMLLSIGDVDRAVDTAKTIVNQVPGDIAFCEIVERLVSIGDIDRAVECTNRKSNTPGQIRMRSVYTLAKTLISIGNVDKAKEILSAIPRIAGCGVDIRIKNIELLLSNKDLTGALESLSQEIKGFWTFSEMTEE